MPLIKSNMPCNHCGSRDALAIYDNGSYCFSCKKYTRMLVRVQQGVEQHKEFKIYNTVSDFRLFPKEAKQFLLKYSLTEEEINESQFQYDDNGRRLWYPVRSMAPNTGPLWECRNFSERSPKTCFMGSKKKAFHIIEPKVRQIEGIILVEDIISAIKVARVGTCLCLFGSQISTMVIRNLVRLHPAILYLWLDADKRREALHFSIKISSFGLKTKIISTPKDPKGYSTLQILDYLTANETIISS